MLLELHQKLIGKKAASSTSEPMQLENVDDDTDNDVFTLTQKPDDNNTTYTECTQVGLINV